MTDAELDRRLAILAGRDAGTMPEHDFRRPDSIAGYRCGEDLMTPMVHCTVDPPSYSDSIDAQHRDLDPLVEAKWGKFAEYTVWSRVSEQFEVLISALDGWPHFRMFGPTRAHARAVAIEAALGET